MAATGTSASTHAIPIVTTSTSVVLTSITCIVEVTDGTTMADAAGITVAVSLPTEAEIIT